MDDGDDVVVGVSAVIIVDYFNIRGLYCLCLTSKTLLKMNSFHLFLSLLFASARYFFVISMCLSLTIPINYPHKQYKSLEFAWILSLTWFIQSTCSYSVKLPSYLPSPDTQLHNSCYFCNLKFVSPYLETEVPPCSFCFYSSMVLLNCWHIR